MMKLAHGSVLPFLCAAVVTTASPIQAGSKFGPDFFEPMVLPRVVQETFQAIVDAPTTGYIGLTASNSSFVADGSLRSTNCNGDCPTVTLPSRDSAMGFGLTAGARNVTESGLFLGGEVFMNQGSGTFRSTNTHTIQPLPGFSGATVEYTQSYRIGREIGARLLMGVELDQFRVYGALGAATANATITIESDSVRRFGHHNTSRTGSVLGAGIEYDVIRNVTIRADMSRTNYGHATYGTAGNGAHSVNMSRSSASIGLFLRN